MKLFMLALAAVLGMAVTLDPLASTAGDKEAPTAGAKMLKMVVHVNFADAKRQGHGLKNIANVLKESGGRASVEVVCHGAGLKLLVKSQTAHAETVEKLHKQGVRFAACENTMREKSVTKDDLLPGVTPVPSGAVEVIRKQQEGYAYFRP